MKRTMLAAIAVVFLTASPSQAQAGRYEFELVRLERMMMLMEKHSGCMWSKPVDHSGSWMLDHPGKGDRNVESNCKAILALAASGTR